MSYAEVEGMVSPTVISEEKLIRKPCLLRRTLAIHDNGIRAERIQSIRAENIQLKKMLEEVDRQWQGSSSNGDGNGIQVTLLPESPKHEGGYKVEYPSEDEKLVMPYPSREPVYFVSVLANVFDNLGIKRKFQEIGESEGLEGEEFGGRNEKRGRGLSLGEGGEKENNWQREKVLEVSWGGEERVLEDMSNFFNIGKESKKGSTVKRYTRKMIKKEKENRVGMDVVEDGSGGWPFAATKEP